MQMEFSTLVNILILQQFQKVHHFQFRHTSSYKKLQKEGEKIAQIALQVNFLKFSQIITLLR